MYITHYLYIMYYLSHCGLQQVTTRTIEPAKDLGHECDLYNK